MIFQLKKEQIQCTLCLQRIFCESPQDFNPLQLQNGELISGKSIEIFNPKWSTKRCLLKNELRFGGSTAFFDLITLYFHYIFQILRVLAIWRHQKIQNQANIDRATAKNVKVVKNLFGSSVNKIFQFFENLQKPIFTTFTFWAVAQSTFARSWIFWSLQKAKTLRISKMSLKRS